jgi:PAS domain S-box-containing protein
MTELNSERADGSPPEDSTLREAEIWLQLLVDSFEDDAAFLLDVGGRAMSWNASVQRVLGYERAEFLGLPFGRLFSPADQTGAEGQLDRARTTGRSVQDSCYVRKSGREVWVRGALTVLWGPHHQLRGYANIIRNRTAEKEAAAERNELLHRERAARADAERADQTKDAFLTAVSHELRTPLNAILGWAHMLSAGHVPPEKTAHAIQTIERNAKAQARLIEDLLDGSRIMSGKFELDVQPMNLSRVVTAAMESFEHEANAKPVNLSLLSCDDAGPIEGDATRLKQVVAKVLANAIKFTPLRGTITVSVGRTDREAELTVRDTGKGLSPEELVHIFDRSYQGHEPETNWPGLGLGLAVARHIIEAHKGTITAASEGEGKGTTVTVRVPFALPRRTAADVTATPAWPDESRPLALAGLCALVVEDQSDSREFLDAVLDRYQMRVCAVDSVRDALEALDTQPVDVIISDIGLKGEDGLTLMRRVRERSPERRGKVPAIAVSAYAGASDRTRALEAGYQTYLAKPLDPAAVIAAVAALIRLA